MTFRITSSRRTFLTYRLGVKPFTLGRAVEAEELAGGLRSVATPVPRGAIFACADFAGQARHWSTQRIISEMKPMIIIACHEVPELLAHGSVPR